MTITRTPPHPERPVACWRRAALAVMLAAALPWAGTVDAAVPSPPVPSSAGEDAPLALPRHGGASLGSLTVEGDSAVRIRFERPALKLDLDPLSAPGLETAPAIAILGRVTPDLAAPLVRASTHERAVRTPRPWLEGFATGTLARLRPDLERVARWQVEIVAATGATISVRSGEGSPPREIPWDGLQDDGVPAPAGLACSHVLTARDKAGNSRRFVGDSFVVPAYRVETPAGPSLLFSANQWRESFGEGGVSPLLVEAATVLNLGVDAGREVIVAVTAATAEEADETGREVIAALAPRLAGAAGRLTLVPVLAAGAPPGGTVRVSPVAGR